MVNIIDDFPNLEIDGEVDFDGEEDEGDMMDTVFDNDDDDGIDAIFHTSKSDIHQPSLL